MQQSLKDSSFGKAAVELVKYLNLKFPLFPGENLALQRTNQASSQTREWRRRLTVLLLIHVHLLILLKCSWRLCLKDLHVRVEKCVTWIDSLSSVGWSPEALPPTPPHSVVLPLNIGILAWDRDRQYQTTTTYFQAPESRGTMAEVTWESKHCLNFQELRVIDSPGTKCPATRRKLTIKVRNPPIRHAWFSLPRRHNVLLLST